MNVKRWFKISKQKDSKIQNDILSRVRAAEKLHKKYRCKKEDVEKTAGVSSSTYSRSIWLLRYGDSDLIEAVNTGEIGVLTAFDRMHERLGNHFPNQKMLESAEILCQTPKMALFRKDGELQLAQAISGARTKLYLLTDAPDIVTQIKRIVWLVYLKGYKLDSEGFITKPDGTPYGHLAHHASILHVNLQCQCRVKRKDGIIDLRQGCVRFNNTPHADSPPVLVYKHLDTIELFSRSSKKITQTDYDLDMFRFLETANLHDSTRDHRLRVKIDNEHDPYLYMLIMACHLYGEAPRDNTHTAGLVDRFCAAYSGMQIDHLNADPLDCRICNLIVMTSTQNRRKQTIQRKLQSRSDLYADLSRHDNTHIKLETGKIREHGEKEPEKTGIYTVDGMLSELASFLNNISKEECE